MTLPNRPEPTRLTPPHGNPRTADGEAPPAYVDVFGTRYLTSDIAATYATEPDVWVDMPEARPRARARANEDAHFTQVYVLTDGQLRYDASDVTIDEYVDPADEPGKYADVRAEGDRRWEGQVV